MITDVTAAVACAPGAVPGARVDHLGIAVVDLEQSIGFYTRMLGTTPAHVNYMPDQGIAVAMFQLENMRIELLQPLGAVSPLTGVLEDHTIQAFMQRVPQGGLHHVCYAVDDLETASPPGAQRLGTGQPIIGVNGMPVVFLNPATTGGTLIELKQSPR